MVFIFWCVMFGVYVRCVCSVWCSVGVVSLCVVFVVWCSVCGVRRVCSVCVCVTFGVFVWCFVCGVFMCSVWRSVCVTSGVCVCVRCLCMVFGVCGV